MDEEINKSQPEEQANTEQPTSTPEQPTEKPVETPAPVEGPAQPTVPAQEKPEAVPVLPDKPELEGSSEEGDEISSKASGNSINADTEKAEVAKESEEQATTPVPTEQPAQTPVEEKPKQPEENTTK